MRHSGPILTIGVILVLLPLLGFPAAWKDFFILVAGLWLCGIALMRLKRHQAKRVSYRKEPGASAVSFVENKIPPEPPKDVSTENTYDQPPQA